MCEFDTLERQMMGVNKYASTFLMASCNNSVSPRPKKGHGKVSKKRAL